MSNDASPSPCPDTCHGAAPLDWLLSLLREAIVGVMADDTPPLKKANALARLGNLYLKIYNTAELVERVAELEERLTAPGVATAADTNEAAGPTGPEPKSSPAPSRTKGAKPSKPRSQGKPHHAGHHSSRPGPRQKAAGRGGRSRGRHG